LVKVPRLGATAARSRHPPLPNPPNGVLTTAEGASFVKTLNADPYPAASCPSARCDQSRREVSVSKRCLRRREGLGHVVNYHCRSTFHQRRVPFLPAPAMGLIAATTILMAQLLMPARHWSALAGPEARLPPRQNGRSSPPATKVTAAPLRGGGVPGPSQRGPAVVVAVWLNGQSMDKLSGMSPGASEGRDFGSVAI
jgi:hypothetical protein